MASVTVDVPDEIWKYLDTDEVSAAATKRVNDRLWKELLSEHLDHVLEDSVMTDERAVELGNELKQGVAERHK